MSDDEKQHLSEVVFSTLVGSYRDHLEVSDPFEAMTGHTAIIDGLAAEVFRGFPQLSGDLCTAPDMSSHYHFYLLADRRD